MNIDSKIRYSNGIYLHRGNQDFWEFTLDIKGLKFRNRTGKLLDPTKEDPTSIEASEQSFQNPDEAIKSVQDALLNKFLEGFEPWLEPQLPVLE
mmetsp:Transcript_41377/g.36738  ORF Transcript_41377/g.36738 Transcript_41377/m.36738 type:complete len:94 (+) Transcript_41377:63-344(+)